MNIKFFPFSCIILITVMVGIGSTTEIPELSDWTNHGAILSAGPSGSWDYQLGGTITPCGIIKKNGTYFLYYIGGSFTGSNGDGRNRSLGVATSTDGMNFTKYSGSPVLTPGIYSHLYSEVSNADDYGQTGEGGIASCAACLEQDGSVMLYYGAMIEFAHDQVYIDVRLSKSANGFDFTDQGLVLDHNDGSIFGGGDGGGELYPVAAFKRDDGQVFIYYTCQASGCHRRVVMASGPGYDNMTSSQQILSTGLEASINFLTNDTAALFVNTLWDVKVYIVTKNSPGILGSPNATYDFNSILPKSHNNPLFPGLEFTHFTVYLDKPAEKWRLYYHLGDPQWPDIALMTAPYSGTTPKEKLRIKKKGETGFRINPNPFKPNTRISFSLSCKNKASLKIFNVKGELVKTLLDREIDAGHHILQRN